MKLYLKLFFSSEGTPTLEIVKRARKAGFKPCVGYYDFVIDFDTPEEYRRLLGNLHRMLEGTKAMYTVMTRE